MSNEKFGRILICLFALIGGLLLGRATTDKESRTEVVSLSLDVEELKMKSNKLAQECLNLREQIRTQDYVIDVLAQKSEK